MKLSTAFNLRRSSIVLTVALTLSLFNSIVQSPLAHGAQSAECASGVGGSADCPATSAQEIYNLYGTTANGIYYIKINGVVTAVYALMTRSGSEGGAWILLMKAAGGSTNFGYSSTVWTDATTTFGDTTTPTNDVSADVKYSAFNSLPITKILAVFKAGAGNYVAGTYGIPNGGDIPSNAFGGHVWRETLTAGSWTAQTRLSTNAQLNSSNNANTVRKTLFMQSDTDTPKYTVTTTSPLNQVFSYEIVSGWYGFSGGPCTAAAAKVRWGLNWNENATVGDFSSCDEYGGIGSSTGYSATDEAPWPGNGVNSGAYPAPGTTAGHRSLAFQIWGKVAEPSLNAVQSLSATISNTTGSVSWSAPAGVTATDYVVEYKPTASSTFSNSLIVTGQTTASISGLTSGTSYDFRVIARTASDSTALSNIASVTAVGPSAQSALTLSSTSGTYGTTLLLTTSGGSGTGAVTYSTGTAGCTIANTDSLTVTSALTCSVTATKAADSNYTAISSSATNVVFAARPISIKAATKSGTYTGSSISVTNSYSISSGTLAGSDTFTALTYSYSSASYSSSQTAPTNAGSYTITPSAATFSVGSASNYSITYETATLTISKANQGALTIISTTSKYGTPLNLRTSGGSGTGALSFAITSSGTASGCSISTETLTVSSFGTCKVTATKALDTNYNVVSSAETIITFAKADTITVTTTLSSSSVTYTESPAAITATQTVTGLVNSETGTIITTYTGYSCEYGGTCVIGDIAPGGGYVFYVSATTIDAASGISTGGIYLATAPQTWSGGSIDPNASWGCGSTNIAGTLDSVGSGAENTRLINSGCSTAGIASRLAGDSSAEGFTDWFIPSLDELTLIYNNLKVSSLSNLQSWNYWSSTQGTTSAYGKYWWFGSGAVNGQTDKNNSAGSNMYVRPIRAFSPTALSSNTIPTDAGVYKVGSTFAISSPASLGNYLAVESVTATLTINKARQKTVTIGQYDAYPNISSYPLNVYGGSGPGTVTRTLLSSGTANCSLASAFILTATSTGTCTVKAEKAGTRNYIVESTTAVIYWIAWGNNYTAQTVEGDHAISISGNNGIVVRTETVTASAFSNTSGAAISSAAVGTTIRINSAGFSGLTPSDLSVTFRPYEDAVINAVTSTYVEVVIPAGASTGVIAIDSPRGVAYTQSFTISP